MSRQVPSRAIFWIFDAVRYCCCSARSSSGSLPSTGLRPKLTWTPSKRSRAAVSTASTLPVNRKFQSVTPILRPCDRARIECVRKVAPPAVKNARRESAICLVLGGRSDERLSGFPFRLQQASQRTQVVQNPAAGLDMQGKLRQIVRDDLQRFFPALRAFAQGKSDFLIHLASGLFNGLGQQRNILMGAFNVVERRFRRIAHTAPLQRATLNVTYERNFIFS